MPLLDVAGITLDMTFVPEDGKTQEELLRRTLDGLFSLYLTDTAGPLVQRYRFERLDNPPDDSANGCPLYEEPHMSVFDADGALEMYFHIPPGAARSLGAENRRYGAVRVSADWTDVRVVEYVGRPSVYTVRYRCRQAFEGFLPLHGAFVFHAAAIDWQGRGLLFTGPSGVGKSTHSGLWAERAGAQVLNGDSPVLERAGRRLLIRGSPWCGTSRLSQNRSVPLTATVVLKQGGANAIRRLTAAEAVGALLPELRRPAWSAEHLELTLDFLQDMLEAAPVFELTCLPEPSSVDCALAEISRL